MEPIIEVIQKDLTTQLEDRIVKVVQEVSIDVDKERLIRAITDAKSFYDEGYADGQNQWISVEDKLPEKYERVVVYDTDWGVTFGEYCGEDWNSKWSLYEDLGFTDDVTHWMSLPEPPELTNADHRKQRGRTAPNFP